MRPEATHRQERCNLAGKFAGSLFVYMYYLPIIGKFVFRANKRYHSLVHKDAKFP
jgi:hypothetical protein